MPEYTSVNMTNEKETFSTGATRESKAGKGRYDLLPHHALRRWAQHMENGAKKHGDRNWEKGLPMHMAASAIPSHLYKHLAGDRSEDHLSAVLFNAGLLIDHEERIEAGELSGDLNDLPAPILPEKVGDVDALTEIAVAEPGEAVRVPDEMYKRIISGKRKAKEEPLFREGMDAPMVDGFLNARKLYLGGPMRGYRDFNYAVFDTVASELREREFEIISPADLDREAGVDPTTDWSQGPPSEGFMRAAMERDMVALTSCDGIVLLPGWEQSLGGLAEVAVVRALKLKVYEYDMKTDRLVPIHVKHLVAKEEKTCESV